MIIQKKVFPDGELVIYKDYESSEHAGAGGCFQIGDIAIEGEKDESILDKVAIDHGKHYHDIDEVLRDLGLDSADVHCRGEEYCK